MVLRSRFVGVTAVEIVRDKVGSDQSTEGYDMVMVYSQEYIGFVDRQTSLRHLPMSHDVNSQDDAQGLGVFAITNS